MKRPRLLERLRSSYRLRRRLACLRALLPLAPRVTVVTVSWNGADYLPVTLPAIRRFSPPGTRLLFVDNDSRDGSREWLAGQPDVRLLALPRNVGHGAALDLGTFAVRTRWVVTLDLDAFPLSAAWIPTVLTAIQNGAAVAGAEGGWVLDRLTPRPPSTVRRPSFVHPCFLAISLRRFLFRGHSFRRTAGGLDVGEAISRREEGRCSFVPPTEVAGPGALGTVFGDVVYHNFYGVRHHALPAGEAQALEGISASDARTAWERAVDRFLAR